MMGGFVAALLKAGRARLDSGLLGSLMLLVAEAVPEVDERGLVEGLKAPVRPETRRRPQNVLGARCRWVCASVRRLVPRWPHGPHGLEVVARTVGRWLSSHTKGQEFSEVAREKTQTSSNLAAQFL